NENDGIFHLFALAGTRVVGPVKNFRYGRFLHDCKHLLSTDPKTGNPVLLDFVTLQPVRTFKGIGVEDARAAGRPFELGISHDGSLIAGMRMGRGFLWETGTGRQLAQFRGHHTQQKFVSFLANETRLLTQGDHLYVWDLTTGREIARFGEVS